MYQLIFVLSVKHAQVYIRIMALFPQRTEGDFIHHDDQVKMIFYLFSFWWESISGHKSRDYFATVNIIE